MRVVVTVEHRFDRTPDGAIWTSGTYTYRFWTRYLAAFDAVRVIARVRNAAAVQPDWMPADGPGVTFAGVPHYIGPWQYVLKALRVRRAVSSVVTEDDAVIMRVSSHLAGCLEPALIRSGRPYGLEVVGDPYDVYSPGAVRHWFRPFFRWWFTRQLRHQCRRAIGVAYVTKKALQARYPCAAYSVGMSDVEISHDAIIGSEDVFTTHYSSVEISKEDAVSACRPTPSQRRFRLVMVGSLAQMYKAPDVLIQAIAKCVADGLDLSLAIIGEGKYRQEFEELAYRLGLNDRVQFLGQLPAGKLVRDQLDAADLFVLPSRCEGLPRAMVEAMARGVPCIGSNVGGIPELLLPEDMAPPGDVAALAAKIQEVVLSPSRMAKMSLRNLAAAQEYREDVLDNRRRAFFDHIRRSTEQWFAARRGATSARDAASSQKAGPMKSPVIIFGMNSLFAVRQFLPEVISSVRRKGFRVLVIAPKELGSPTMPPDCEDVEMRFISMKREISPLSDIRALWQIWSILRSVQPAITNMSTPKMGLVGGLAAFLAGVPNRIYTLRGLRYETTRFWKRAILMACEKVACACAHQVICISHSVKESVLRDRLAPQDKTTLLGERGSEGITIPPPGRKRACLTPELRGQIGIPPGAEVIGFVGRLTKDKGIRELVEAFRILRSEGRPVRLLLLGDFESGDPVERSTADWIRTNPDVHWLGYVPRPEPYFRLMDVFVFPTYREGLPKVLLEAATAGTPVVSTHTTGVVDVVQDGLTGILVPPGDAIALARATARLLSDRPLAARMAAAGKLLVQEHFNNAIYLERLGSMLSALAHREPVAAPHR